MRSLALICTGAFVALTLSWACLILVPDLMQIGRLDRTTSQLSRPDTGELIAGLTYRDEQGNLRYGVPDPDDEFLPRPIPPGARRGQSHYVSLGCIYCHTQQVRRPGFGADSDRGWGDRQSVARDYILQDRVVLGSSRTGPDLMDVGSRLTEADWHHLHLYNPQITSPGSIMPPYPFLYEKRPVPDGGQSPDALSLPERFAIEEGYEIVPTRRARELVAYLLALRLDYELPEQRRAEEE